MRKMFILYLAIVLLALPAMAVWAQDDDSTCADVDLTDLKALIAEIESTFVDGDTSAAGNLIDEAIAELDALKQACIPVTTGVFTSEDGTFSFVYPLDLVYEDQYGTYVFGTSQDAIDLFGGSSPEFPVGEYGFGVLLPDAMTFGDDMPGTIEDVVNALKAMIVESNDDFSAGDVEFHAYNDRPGAIFDFDGPAFAGTVIITQVTDEQYIALVSGAHPDERDSVRVILEAVAESIRYQP